ncbi:MAG: MerR family transcriptional regulator [Lachnospiraceae bacterium]|nr:MerR family transcriptional regulator [Lachnospiraceae bacterium]
MDTRRYMISDASKQVDVESHVLRYWEEELELDIPRNEMGHRYYTEENIKVLKNIKLLKEQGFQLKAIKMIVPELGNIRESNLDYMLSLKDELNEKALEEQEEMPIRGELANIEDKPVTVFKSEEKMHQFQMVMSNIVAKALQENNALLGKEVSERVSDNVLKEMDYLMRMREEREDERFKQLDETIRTFQKNRHLLKDMDKARNVKNSKKRGAFRKVVI